MDQRKYANKNFTGEKKYIMYSNYVLLSKGSRFYVTH